jgi:hypothetical protein
MDASKSVFTTNTIVYGPDAIRYFDGYYSLAEYENGRVRPEYLHA